MNEKELTRILGRCLDQVTSGKTVSACLAEHPAHAAELKPLLAMAEELGALSDHRLSESARQRTRAALLRAEAARNDQRSKGWWQPGAFAASRLAVSLVAVLLCVLVAAGMVAASRPGDLAYGVRVVTERVPAWLTRGPASRAQVELGIADRRLADLDRTMSSQEQHLDPRTVTALLASAERAAVLATSLPEAERAQISARLAEQARRMVQLRQISRSAQNGAALQVAAERVQRAAERMGAPPLSPDDKAAGPGAGLTPTPAQSDPPPPTAERTPTPGSHATQQSPSRPAQITTAPDPGPNATAPGAGPSATPQGPGPNATAPGAGPSATPQGPGPNAAAPGPGSAATPGGEGPESNSQDPGAGSDSGEGPGPSH